MSIEDKLLKKNIPGKHSWWEKDGDEDREMARAFDPDAADPQCCAADNSDGALIEEQRQLAMAGVPEPLRHAHAAQRLREKGNTGVKGVLKDYREWRDNENETQRLEQELRNYLLMRVARGAERSVEDSQAIAEAAAAAAQQLDDSDEDDDGDDDEFMEEYRAARLRQLQAAASKPIFGSIREVSAADYLEEVDGVDPRVSVVVHLYEPYIGACQKMNRALELLARRYPGVKFLRMLADQCRQATGQVYDHVGLPTLVVYRAGETISAHVRVQDELSETFGADDVEWLLSRDQVFESLASGGASAPVAAVAGATIAEYSAQDARNLHGETVNASGHFRETYEAFGGDAAAEKAAERAAQEARIADLASRMGGSDPLAYGGESRWDGDPAGEDNLIT